MKAKGKKTLIFSVQFYSEIGPGMILSKGFKKASLQQKAEPVPEKVADNG